MFGVMMMKIRYILFFCLSFLIFGFAIHSFTSAQQSPLQIETDQTVNQIQSDGQVYIRVTVEAGDTLWKIASQFVPDDDINKSIHRIMKVNGMISPEIFPGEILRIPVS